MSKNAARLTRLEAMKPSNTPKKWVRFIWHSNADDSALAATERQCEAEGWGLIINRIVDPPKRAAM